MRCTTRGFKGNDRAGVLNPVPAASVLVLRWFVTAQGVSSVGSHAEIWVSRLGLLPLVFAGHILYMVSACCAGATTRRALLMLRLHTLRYFWAGLERTTLLRVLDLRVTAWCGLCCARHDQCAHSPTPKHAFHCAAPVQAVNDPLFGALSRAVALRGTVLPFGLL